MARSSNTARTSNELHATAARTKYGAFVPDATHSEAKEQGIYDNTRKIGALRRAGAACVCWRESWSLWSAPTYCLVQPMQQKQDLS